VINRVIMIMIMIIMMMIVIRVSDASGSVEFDDVKVGSISKSDLDSNVCKTHLCTFTTFREMLLIVRSNNSLTTVFIALLQSAIFTN